MSICVEGNGNTNRIDDVGKKGACPLRRNTILGRHTTAAKRVPDGLDIERSAKRHRNLKEARTPPPSKEAYTIDASEQRWQLITNSAQS